ncbi:hypothetical protein CMQ_183 [Grosmannia clavigera kw1407]|uniref:Uncharacterized protein n=1 Tax=Grosmannia clavigera (strain kw1407 / UAMH 11150) TaxID=655863 RepID=F0XRA4_GROCL|nr:uncharacterized protein CMQ_183 [Grosmannia clavigera kw1407]EFW99865.1 hypothetical protein CMQ_183 [Grosmannia clavigera kw1407]
MMPYMSSSNYAAYPQPAQMNMYNQSEAFLEDMSKQLVDASSVLRRRHSRGSAASQRTPGSAMRIVKPSSASNSPRSMTQARRRTVVTDDVNFVASQQPIHVTSAMVDPQAYFYPPQQQYAHTRDIGNTSRPARPVSWHPSSTLAVPNQFALSMSTQFQMQAYGTPAMASAIDPESFPCLQSMTFSPAAYSSQTSPSTSFSPYSGAFDTHTASQFYSPNPWAVSPSINANGIMFDKLPSPVDCPALVPTSIPSQSSEQTYQQPQMQQQAEPQNLTFVDEPENSWNTLASQGFSRCAAPPTPPDNYYSTAANPVEAPLQEDESDGEILVGMGLYDSPNKELVDITLESYRSSVAQLMGAGYKYPEPTGKGLKLEDAWEPPENMDNDDDNDDEDDDEDDAEGEDQ